MKIFKDAEKRLRELEGLTLDVGWNEGNRYDDNTPVAAIAEIHEYGAPAAGIPPRPFIRPAIINHGGEWGKNISKGCKAVMNGRVSPKDMLLAVGSVISADIQTAIRDVKTPELAERTKRSRDRKKRAYDPLNDSGYMIATVNAQVNEK